MEEPKKKEIIDEDILKNNQLIRNGRSKYDNAYPGASDLEFGVASSGSLHDLDRLGILPACHLEEILDVYDLLRLHGKDNFKNDENKANHRRRR